jgi:hypothetical protein
MAEAPVSSPFQLVSRVHRSLGHPVRTTSAGHQAYCVACLLLWTAQDQSYRTDLLEVLEAS